MTPIRNLSIRNKLVGSILLTTALSLLAGFAVVVADDVQTYRHDAVDAAVLVARVIGDNTVSALAFGDRDEAAKILARIAAVPNVEAAHLYDAEGRPFAAFDRSPAARSAPPPQQVRLHAFREGSLHVFEPVVHRNERYGTIHLETSTRPLEAKIQRRLWVLLSVLMALIVLSLLVAVSLQRLISGPILRLAETARWISRARDYSVRAEKAGDDEIGVLCDGFNDMLAELGRKNAELQEKSTMLETLYRQEREVTRTLQDLNEMKTNFLVVTSHELRTPLTVIRGYTEALLAGVIGRLSATERDSLQACQRMIHRMVEAVSNIQQMLEINEGLVMAKPAAVDVRATVSDILDGLAPFISQRLQRVVLEAPEAVHVMADKDKVELVLVNLIQNAIKFTDDGGRISVRVAAEGDMAHVAVEDTGIGIEPSEIERIFERFYTSTVSLDHHRSGKYQFEARGAGLGLAIARGYVEAHGGRIWAESAGRGKGSCFHVVLPMGARSPALTTQARSL